MGEPEITFTQFPNFVLDPLVKANLSGKEFNIMLYVVRMTFGYRKDHVKVSLSELSEFIGMERANVSRAVNKLCKMGWLSKISASGTKSQMLGIGKMFNNYCTAEAVENCEVLPLSKTTTVVADNNTNSAVGLSCTTTEGCCTEQQRVVVDNNTTLYLNKIKLKENFKEREKFISQQKNSVCNSKQEKVKQVSKKAYGQNHNVTLTEDEYSQLVSDYGEDVTLKFINRMDLWIKAKGRAPNDCFSELLVWLERDGKAPDPDVEKYKCLVNQF